MDMTQMRGDAQGRDGVRDRDGGNASGALSRPARVVVFDSGLGGLTVLRDIRARRPDVEALYVADDAAFPYGPKPEALVVSRVLTVIEDAIAATAPDAVVIACNTASTLVLGPLRARWPAIPFIGTVPAVKPAAAASRSGLISVLATPGTVSRDYTRKLIDDFAGRCAVTLVGATRLAGLAEDAMRGRAVADAEILAEIAPCFVEKDGRRTDAVALACTHYPLLIDAYRRLAPWPVTWVDPAPAIARRLDSVLSERGLTRRAGCGDGRYAFTSGRDAEPGLARWLSGLSLRQARDRGGFAAPATSPALT